MNILIYNLINVLTYIEFNEYFNLYYNLKNILIYIGIW